MKERLDVLLVQKGFFTSREKAKASVMAGIVFVDGQRCDKVGTQFKEDAEIIVKGSSCPFVSRGGLKLKKAVEDFDITLENAICMDIGASTGGFTDCMLQNGASKVFAIDVGYGQLDWKLRNNNKVINIEKCNVRYLEKDTIGEDIDFISIDVSFISLKLVLPKASELLREDGQIVCLIKPQFEAGKDQVGKNGIVRDQNVHIEVINNVISYAVSNNLAPQNLTYSPITGAKGNVEYLLHLYKSTDMIYNEFCVKDIVLNSATSLNI